MRFHFTSNINNFDDTNNGGGCIRSFKLTVHVHVHMLQLAVICSDNIYFDILLC